MNFSSLLRGFLILNGVLQIKADLQLQSTMADTEDSAICDTTLLQESCTLMDLNKTIDDLRQEVADIAQCLHNNTYESDNRFFMKDNTLTQNITCAIRAIQSILRENRVESNNSTEFDQILSDIQSGHLFNQVRHESKNECLYCVYLQSAFVLNISFNRNTESERMIIHFLKMSLLLRQNLYLTSNESWVIKFFDAESWTDFFNNQTNHVINIMDVYKEVENSAEKESGSQQCSFDTSCVKNCGFGSECVYRPVLLVFYISALVSNGLLIAIFIRNREMRTERNNIILNLAICDILSVLLNGCLQILYIFGSSYDEVRIYYRITDLCFEVTTGVCIYTIVALSIQRYFAMSTVNRCNGCVPIRHCNSTIFICCLWFAGCLPQAIDLVTDISPRGWILRNLILYCAVPIVATVTFYVMTSVRLRKSVRKMPGKATGQETARMARVRSSNVLIALIIVFIVSYTPIQLFRFMEIWFYGGDYLFDYVDLLAYSLLSVNSCFNPIALYVASGTFRRYYNKYLCCAEVKQDTSISLPSQKKHSSVKSSVSTDMLQV